MKKTRLSVTLAIATLLSVFGGILGWCATVDPSRVQLNRAPLTQREQRLRHVPVHASEFSPLAEPLALSRCGASSPPEALATPDPLLKIENADQRVRVSFIVGADGHVYSPFIMDSGGPSEDQVVLHVVKRWRYRPALCNGVPTDAEARVLFSSR
jgi:hypothetical protein